MNSRIDNLMKKEAYKIIAMRILVNLIGIAIIVVGTIGSWHIFWYKTTKDVLYFVAYYAMFGTLAIMAIMGICQEINKAYYKNKIAYIKRVSRKMTKYNM